jgi:hypothetical protein
MISISQFAFAFVVACCILHIGTCRLDHTDRLRSKGLEVNHQTRDLQAVGTIDRLLLIDSNKDEPILYLTNGTIIDTAFLRTTQFNIKVNVDGIVGSMKFGYNENSLVHRETGPTYAFCGHEGSDYYTCDVLGIGEHTITVTPYSERSWSGVEGTEVKISFTIVSGTIPRTCNTPKVRGFAMQN